MAATAEPRDTVFAAGRCHAGHRPLATATAVCYAPGHLIEKDAGPECILWHAGAVVHGRLRVQRWEQPGRRMSPLREELSRGKHSPGHGSLPKFALDDIKNNALEKHVHRFLPWKGYG
ncbi:uncharacterized protein [Triticum aestivum]|uniref:uncharacterized protein n=1 Tax=Triticum aestivum TaxID=4565 RepID=UPI001D01634F|nr:uncharacterized protein LOC123044800 [Triticum aestivum]